jgi:post-segregation antitoxin (ccd killing protein)
MRMARVNVYLPDELARAARAAGLNISKVTQEALGSTLAHSETDRWVDRLERLPCASLSHASVIDAIDEARMELGDSVRA